MHIDPKFTAGKYSGKETTESTPKMESEKSQWKQESYNVIQTVGIVTSNRHQSESVNITLNNLHSYVSFQQGEEHVEI